MKIIYFSVVAMFLFLSGCATTTGALDYSNVSDDYQPKEQYAVSYDKAWDSVNKVLFNEGIIAATSDKDAGRILTDYVDAGVQVSIMGSMTKRFKYSISFEKVDKTTTKIKIIGKLETMTDTIAWHDVSSQNKKQVQKIVNQLYQKIEAEL